MTWAEVGVANAGLRTTLKALRFAMMWGLASATLGHEPQSIEEFAEFWEDSRATAFREQQAFRKAFPTETTPTRMNVSTGSQDRFAEVARRTKDFYDRKALTTEVSTGLFKLGAALADVG